MVPIADTCDDRAVHVMMEAVDGRFWEWPCENTVDD
jgi:hypothetical protein